MRRVKEIEGRHVTKLCFQPNLHLTLEPVAEGHVDYSEGVVVSLSGTMDVQEKGVAPVQLRHSSRGSDLALLNNLPEYSFVYGSCLVRGTVRDDGTLVLEFEHGTLEVPALNEVESWEMYNDKGFRMICMPGGEVAVWSEDALDISPGGDGSPA